MLRPPLHINMNYEVAEVCLVRIISEIVRYSVLIPSYNLLTIFLCVWKLSQQLKQQFFKENPPPTELHPMGWQCSPNKPIQNLSASSRREFMPATVIIDQGGTITPSTWYRLLPLPLVSFQNLKVRFYYWRHYTLSTTCVMTPVDMPSWMGEAYKGTPPDEELLPSSQWPLREGESVFF